MQINSTLRSWSSRVLVLGFLVAAFSTASFGQFRVAITFGPPAIPVYEQPVCPGDGYMWVPGYWYWDDDAADYYWVPGTWVLAPEVGYLWTPGWWGWGGNAFLWHEGWWGPEVGFYGGINYGFGYFGVGFGGGRWEGGHFFYNTAVLHVNETVIHNVYNARIENVSENRVSYNGGNGGIEARPTPQQEAAANGRHVGPVSSQMQHIQEARNNPQLRASANQGRPPIAATERAGDFKSNIVAAREAGAPYRAPNRVGTETRGMERPESTNAVHPKDLPPIERPTANSGDAKADQKYQKQQQKLAQQQDKERQKLQQQQDREHQQLQQRQASQEETQKVEQKHQQQTQQLQQRHQQQQQHLQSRMPAPRSGGKK
ncbi:MAG: YXWGXW repeat-containing protein [Candidatus Sulfotelmatobacter sp.]